MMVLDVLDSLAFKGMDYREQDLKKPWARTFEWLAPVHADSPEDSNIGAETQPYQRDFKKWLRSSDSHPFWICGKAGSGKSTLMKRLFHQTSFREEVRRWAATCPVAFASFYFFKRGSSVLQKSQEGMMRAVLHQFISQHHDPSSLIEHFVRHPPAGRQQLDSTKTIEWDLESLNKAIHLIKDQADTWLCLFLDGLDECDPSTDSANNAGTTESSGPTANELECIRKKGYESLCQLIMDLSDSTNIKICISGRELNVFSTKFGKSPMLRLEDLSRRDISTYITEKLDTTHYSDFLESDAPERMKQIAVKITAKAHGVFLWVKLVVERIVDDIEDGADIEQLNDLVEAIPDELDDLFSRMLDDIKPRFRKCSPTLFQIVLTSQTWRPLTAVTLHFAEKVTTEDVSKTSIARAEQRMERPRADEISAAMRRRLRSHSGGLIELSHKAQGLHNAPATVSLTDPGFHVQFIHQTVNDFIDRKGGLSAIFGPTCEGIYHDSVLRLLRSSIHGLSVLHTRVSSDDVEEDYRVHMTKLMCNWQFVHAAIHWARILDLTEQHADELTTLLECLDAVGKIALQIPEWSSATHWVASEQQESGGRDPGAHDNFLSYMIQAGIENYAQRKLQGVVSKPGKPYLEYALATHISDHPMAMYAEQESGAWDAIGVHPSSPRFVKFLLDHGADPNESWISEDGHEGQTSRRTVWESALKNGVFRVGSLVQGGRTTGHAIYDIGYRLAQPDQKHRDQQRCLEHLKLLLEYGADAGLSLDYRRFDSLRPDHLGLEFPATPSELIKSLLPAQGHRSAINEILEMLDQAIQDRQ